MPELPEVETVRRQLEPEIEGQRIERLEVLDERWSRPVPPARLGKQVVRADDRARSAGAASTCCSALDGEQTLVMHLRMTGNLVLVEAEDARPLGGDAALRGRADRLRAPPAGALRARRRAPSSGSPTRAASARPS